MNVTAPDVLRAIVDQARAAPDLLAVRDLGREVTYGQLINEAARLGAGLAALGVVEGDRVALLLPNSVDFVTAALASLWIGAIFVPLAVTDPEARLATIVLDCKPVVVVTSDTRGERSSTFSSLAGAALTSFSAITISGLKPKEPLPTSARVAYAIYTSGTTGTPKGVLIGTTAFGAAVQATSNALGLNRATRTLCVSPFHFDGSFATLFPTLFSGGAVILRPREALLFPRTFFNAVADEAITYTGFSPSYLRLLLSSPQVTRLGESQLDVIALGGEASSISDVRALWAHAPKIRVFNRYGPTETAIAVTHVHLTPEVTGDAMVPMGTPHSGVSFHLIDDEGSVIEGPDQVGALYIGGSQLMDGYWGATELTNDVLRNDVVAGEVVYRTGDLVYKNRQGNYVYVDRSDRVVKRSGVRVSLIELSVVMRGLANVSAAACVAYDDEDELAIAAFVVVDAATSALELRRLAAEQLPDTMLPNRIEFVERLPLNSSSKLDERLLLSEAGLRPL